MYRSIIADYPSVSVEDPFDQDDFHRIRPGTNCAFAKKLLEKLRVVAVLNCFVLHPMLLFMLQVGDDPLVTNPTCIQTSIEMPDVVVLLDAAAVRVGVVVAAAASTCAAAAACVAAAVSAFVVNAGVVSLPLLEFTGCYCCCSCQSCCSCFCCSRAHRFYDCVTRLYFTCCTLHTHTPLANSMTPRVLLRASAGSSFLSFLRIAKRKGAAAAQAAAAEEEAMKTRPAPLAESDWEPASGVAQRRAEAKATTKATEHRDAATSQTREENWAAP